MTTKEHNFSAEIGKVLHLMIHSLYTNKDIFLRELISNASDACDKLRYESLTNNTLLEENKELKVSISLDEKNKTITIADNGIGMNEQDLINNLGTIAKSGTKEFIENITSDKKNDVNFIGQFGVGFYSSFMVADKVEVISRKAGEENGYSWISDGLDKFSIEKLTSNVERGTKIILHLNEESKEEYLDKYKIEHIVKTYSDHISVPVVLMEEKEEKTLNGAAAIWQRDKKDITDEQYKEFYRSSSHLPGDPFMTIHSKVEGAVSYACLLFIPSHKPFDLFHPDRMTRVKLYVKRVFITEENLEIIPRYLRFIRGVIDSDDLPLNISRETLQDSKILTKIKDSVIKKILNELKRKLENDRNDYREKFWKNFGAVIKEGLCEAIVDRDTMLDICMFKSSKSPSEFITLADYIARMPEDQKEIYYFIGEENEDILSNPQLEGFKSKDIEVLFFVDTVDSFWVNVIQDYKGKDIKSITRADIDLESATNNGKEDQTPESIAKAIDEEEIIKCFMSHLEGLVKAVKVSSKLKESPACLSVESGAMDIRMEKFLLDQKQIQSSTLKILEVNSTHPVIKKIYDMYKNNANKGEVKDAIITVFEIACLSQGESIKNTGAFTKRMVNFIEKGL